MLEMYRETDTGNADPVEMQELWDLCESVAKNYQKQWRDADSQFKVLATELQFAIPLTETLTYTGTIDLVLEDKDGKVWFMDHKTTNNIESYEKRVDMDRQISRYWYALQQLGYDVQGFIYNIILKDVPEAPAVLKNGTLSKNKSAKTTYQLYLDAIMDNHENADDYEEILQHLKAQETENGNRFFRRIKVYRLQAEIDNSIQELIDVAADMDGARIYRNITKDCSWDCSFQSLCQSSMDGSNVDYLKNQLFTTKGNGENGN
ncbi:PD-(D/E)XK nuclease superfamily [uncultured Caudovirales phage]|uniref:PD-(D/E)XK nuclease superfamily n=1 Tax=uncultured Caudovirales phage TaxID=2100421 RepID=A0A6J5MCX7_9CAUD|nr:PD-(D/E)XK nuclease superfamily [uncultured Caudovirales phage]